MGRKRVRPRDSSSLNRDQPLRRSARLLGLDPPTAEPEKPGEEPAGEPPTTDAPFAMKLAIPPPERVAVGATFSVPIVVTFTATEPTRESELEFDAVSRTSGVWAYLSLMSEDRSQSLAPPNSDLLQGQIVDSIHPIMQAQEGDVQTIGYATFANLVVSEPGRYCFRVSIIDMNDMEFEGSAEGGKVLPSLHSAPFDVVIQAEEEIGDVKNNTEVMAHLKEIGVQL